MLHQIEADLFSEASILAVAHGDDAITTARSEFGAAMTQIPSKCVAEKSRHSAIDDSEVISRNRSPA
jgi:hypothetical protein